MLFSRFLLKVLKEMQYSGEKGNGIFPFYKRSSKRRVLAHPNPTCLGCTVLPALSDMLGHAARHQVGRTNKMSPFPVEVPLTRELTQRPEMDAQRKVRTRQVHIMAPQVFCRGFADCDVMCPVRKPPRSNCGISSWTLVNAIQIYHKPSLLSLCEG